MAPDDRRFADDAFSPSRLPVALEHPPRPGRSRLFAAGAVAVLVIALAFLADAFLGGASSVSRGPLSDSHALFGQACETCHTPGEGPLDAKCISCHEKAGDPLGSYSFARHYIYRSNEFDRSAPSSQEGSCATCHTEHRGRSTSLQRVTDTQCLECHADNEFRSDHPEFDFLADRIDDAANLRFPHVLHVREVVDDEQLNDIEAACLRCHQPEPDGRSFQPISFALHCDDCHFTRTTATPFLPLATAGAPVPGIRPLASIRQDPDGIAAGAEHWDPNEFDERAGQIRKQPLYHEDPWVIYNLNSVRRRLYPTAVLADLLKASADPPPGTSPRILHREAIATLRARIQTLRGEPSRDVQNELRALEELLQLVEQRLEDPYAPVDESKFEVRAADRAAGLDSGALDEAAHTTFIDSLTAECRSCHIVERATLLRVQKDQRTLTRAEFDHRAHIIHEGCLGCHTAIPVRDWVERDDDPSIQEDAATIQNVPAVAKCRDCHGRAGPADSCTTCHLFHPDRSHWSNLSRYRRVPG